MQAFLNERWCAVAQRDSVLDPAGELNSDKRERLELEKLEREVNQLRKSDFRAALSSLTPVVFGIAAVVLGVSSYSISAAVNHAGEEQRRFDNYSKLSEAFAKGGSQKLAAVVNLRTFLRAEDVYASQTAVIFANDLRHEEDPVAREAIVAALKGGGPAAFGETRQLHIQARQRLEKAAWNYVQDSTSLEFNASVPKERQSQQGYAAFVIRTFAKHNPGEPLVSSGVEEFRRLDFSEQHTGLFDELSIVLPSDGENWSKMTAEGSPNPRRWLKDFLRDAPAFILTSEILESMLRDKENIPRTLDASGIALRPVYLEDADLSQVHLDHSILSGYARGVDLSNGTFNNAIFVNLYLGPSRRQRASLCGAQLDGAALGADFNRAVLNKPADAPDLAGANWWDLIGLPRSVERALAQQFPRSEQERLRALGSAELIRFCVARHAATARGGGPSPP